MGEFRQFVNPGYAPSSPAEDVERTVNLFTETIESAAGKNSSILLGTPGLSLFTAVDRGPQRGSVSTLGRFFFVAQDVFYEGMVDGTVVARGTVDATVLSPVSFAVNGVGQMCIISAGVGYIFNLNTNSFLLITAAGFLGSNFVVAVDGYFICAKPSTNTFFISGLNDGLAWDALDFAKTEGASGNIQAVVSNYSQIWFICDTHTEVYFDSGDALFPFTRANGGFIEKGCAAAYSAVLADNSVFWLAWESAGGPQVMRSNGYQPVRVSNFAIEYAISTYPVIFDAEAYAYEEAGHLFYVLTFPTQGATWVYDISNSSWHERAYFSGGSLYRHRARTFAYAFGKNLVGDYQNGNIYQMSLANLSDNGDPIKRIRIAPHISNELKRNFYDEFVLDTQVGVGLSVASGQPGYDPQVSLFVSRDGGRTWGPELMTSLGKIGEYSKRAVWRRLGRARDMVFRVECSDPVKIAWVNAYLKVRAGN